MKHFNFLSNLLSLSLGSPCTDVSLDRRLTVGSPSGRYCSGLMQLVFILAILLTVGVGNVWGTETSHTCSGTSGTIVTSKITWAATSANWNSPQCRIAANGTVVFTLTGVNVTKIVMGFSSSSYIGNWSSSGGGSFSSNNSTVTWTGTAGAGTLTFTTSAAARLKTIKVTHTDAASCTVTPTVGSSLTSVSATVNSITATVPISAIGGCNITENGLVYSTSVATPTVGAANCTKVTTTACGSTAVNKTVTISDLPCGTSYYVRGYATNAAGTSYTNVTTQSTSACPLYTVTLMDDSDTRTQASYGAAVTLPSRAGCSGYTFAGWSTTYNANWTTTAPTIISAGSYTPTDNINLYPVYTKTEGGGSGTLTIVPETYTNKGTNAYGSGAERTGTVGTINLGAHYVTGNAANTPGGSTAGQFLQCQGNNANIYNKTALPGKITQVVLNQNSATAFSLYCGTEQLMSSDNTSTGQTPSGTAQTAQSAATQMTWTVSGNYTYFDIKKGSSAGYITSIVITYGSSTTYYISVPNCCTPLGSINGSFSWSNVSPTSVTVGVPSDYSDKSNANLEGYIFKRYAASTGGSALETIETNSSSGTTATFSDGLVANTEYFYTIIAKHSSSSCNSEETSPRKSHTITSYIVSYAAGTGGSGTNPGAHDPVLSGTSITLKANTFTAPEGKQFSTWNDGSADHGASTSYTVTANKTMTAQWSCITPTISSSSISNASYSIGDTPADLSVTASGGTLSYEWKQCATENGTYVTVTGGTGGNTDTYTPPTSAASDLWYQCTVTNTGSSCNTTATSGKAHIIVSAPSYRLWTAWANGNDCDGDICNTWNWTGGSYFVNYNSTNEWRISNFTIPDFEWDAVNQRQMIYNVAGKNTTNTKFYDLAFAVSQGTASVKKGPMPGAVGTLRMYDNSDQPNGYLGFIPNNYMVRFGTHDYIMTETSSTVWETAIQTLAAADLTNESQYRVGVTNSSDEFVAINENCPLTNVTSMGQKSNAGNNWGSNLAAGDAGQRGKFRIWLDNATANWTCHFVPYHRIVFDANYPVGAIGDEPADTYSVDVSVEETNSSISLASAPTAPAGYTFAGWFTESSGGTQRTGAQTISAGATADVTLFAHWTANDNTAYTVKHYQQNIADNNYTEVIGDRQNLTGTTGASVTPAVKSYTGFTAPSTQTATILGDGSLVIEYQYSRNSYNLTWNLGGGTTTTAGTGIASGVSVNTTSSIKFGTSLTAPTVTKTGYGFSAWNPAKAATMPAEATSYTATWSATNYTITYNLNSGTNPGGAPTGFTIESSEITLPTPTRAGYRFDGWYANVGLTGDVQTTIPAGSTGNKEYWAKWTAETDTYKTALHTGASGWTSYASGVEMSGANYAIPAPSSVTKGATSSCEDTHYHFAGWVTDANKEAGTISGNIIPATGTTDATGTTYWAVWEKEAAGGGSLTKLTSAYVPTEGDNLVIVAVDGDDKYALYQQTISSSYVAFWNFSNDAATVGADDKNYVTLVSDGGTGWYLGDATNGYVYNGSSNNLTVDANSHTSFSITWNSSGFNIVGNSRWLSCRTDLTGDNDNKYRMGGATSGNASGTALFDLYKYVGVSYEDPKAVCEACLATPSISGVSLTGSAFSTTSVPVQATGAAAGTNCSITEYGFYWDTSADPSTNNTSSNNLSTGTFSATLTGPFETGTTYHYRAYATNEGDNTGYSSDATFTLHNVTFNMHDHGDAKAAQVVPEGGKVTNPGNPSATGYTFDGWWANSTFSGSAWDFSTNTVGSGDLVLHAKWTEKPKYTITLNAGNGTISDANWTNTSGSTYTRRQANGDEEITLPTPSCGCAGWVFKGWSTTSKDNAASFTPDKEDGASFTPASDVIYYAVYRQSTPSGTTYTKITDEAALTTGDYLIVAYSSYYYAMGNSITSGHMTETSSSNATSWSNPSATLVWTIIKVGDKVGFYNANANKFLTIVDGAWVLDATDGQKFSYSFNSSTKAWTFTSPSGKQMRYASFYYVGDEQSSPIYLYKRGDAESGNYYTNPSCSDYSVTGVANPAAGGSVQLTAAAAKSGDKVWACYTADPEYDFTSWSISGTGVSPTSATTQFVAITVGSGDVTAQANFAAKVMYNVTWKAKGETLTGEDLGSASVRVENGHYITALPPTPTSCETGSGKSEVFMGWVVDAQNWSGKTNDLTGITIYKKLSEFPAVSGDVTYHAVWAALDETTNEWVKVEAVDNLNDGETVAFISSGDAYYLPNAASASGNAPTATAVTKTSGNINFVDAMKFTAIYNSTYDGFTFESESATGKYLWAYNNNKGIYISATDESETNASNIWYLEDFDEANERTTGYGIGMYATTGSGNYRYLSTYNDADWRSYKEPTVGTGTPTVLLANIYRYVAGHKNYMTKCCSDAELAFDGEYNYQTLVRQDIHGARGGNGSATAEQGKATLVLDYSTESGGTCTVEVKKLTGGDNRSTAVAGSDCSNHTNIAINESTKKVTFDIWTYAGSYPTANGQGTYRIKITQAATSTYCDAVTYYFVDVTLRDKFVDAVNGNTTINVDGQSKSTSDKYKTPTEASLDGDKNDDCHSTTRRFLGWVREDNMDTWYGSSSDRTRDLDDKKDDAALVAPNADIITTGSTWYAVWGIEE